MLKRLKDLYGRLGGAVRLNDQLRQHDKQIAQLGAVLAALWEQMPGLDDNERDAVRGQLEGFLAYHGAAAVEAERLATLYESLAGRVAVAEMELETLRKDMLAVQASASPSVEDNQASC